MNAIWVSEEGRRAVHDMYADMLGRWPVANEQRPLRTRLGETFVVVSGPASAPPVMMLQGSGANNARWVRDIAAWAAHHCVYAVDVIGEPGFNSDARPPLGCDAYASWLDDVMQALRVSRTRRAGSGRADPGVPR